MDAHIHILVNLRLYRRNLPIQTRFASIQIQIKQNNWFCVCIDASCLYRRVLRFYRYWNSKISMLRLYRRVLRLYRYWWQKSFQITRMLHLYRYLKILIFELKNNDKYFFEATKYLFGFESSPYPTRDYRWSEKL